jgi:hypothetical protein
MLSGLPHHTMLLQLATHVLALYACVGVMGIGFATMCAGERGARAAARFFFLRPLQSLNSGTRRAVMIVVASICAGLGKAITLISRGIATELKELAADVRWLISGR